MRHPEEALLHFGSRIFNMATSYHRISGDHLADHLIYLSLVSLSPRPSSSSPLRHSCAIHCCCHPRIAIPPYIAVSAVPSIAIAITVAVAPSIAVIAIALPSLYVLQMLLRRQLPLRRRCIAIVPIIASTVAIAVAPSIAVHHRCRCVVIAVAIFTAAVAVAILAAATTARFC